MPPLGGSAPVPSCRPPAPVKLPRLLAEELAFHQLAGNGAAVDRDERPSVRGPTGWISRATSSLLVPPRRRCAPVPACHPHDHLAQLLHRRAEAPSRRALEGQFAVVGLVAQPGGRCYNQALQGAQVERLGEEVEGAQLQGAHRGLDVAVRGDDGAGQPRAARLAAS